MPPTRASIARATGLRAAPVATLLCAVAACGGTPAPFATSLSEVQVRGLDAAWSQRITTLSSPADTVDGEATKLYRACQAMNQGSTFLQAVHATCGPTSVSAKLRARIPERCAEPTRQCIRALDRAKAANDTLLAALLQLTESVKSATEAADCRAEFTTDPTREQRYRDLSSAYDALALGIERGDEDIATLGRRRVEEAEAAISSRLTINEQIARFRQACGITDE